MSARKILGIGAVLVLFMAMTAGTVSAAPNNDSGGVQIAQQATADNVMSNMAMNDDAAEPASTEMCTFFEDDQGFNYAIFMSEGNELDFMDAAQTQNQDDEANLNKAGGNTNGAWEVSPRFTALVSSDASPGGSCGVVS